MALKATPNQIYAMMITERITSVLSLLGILFILSTFLLGRGFDKPINRLFFFASFSNLGMNIAALIAEDGVSAGQNSSLCQFQAFAIQWFLGVDTLWALCMGFNVYLALFRGWTTERMRRQEWKYFLGCYGCSFIPALVYLFVNTKRRGKVYGPALLWCWIVAPEWDFLRIATLYGIVWVALIFAWIIYVMAFNKVWNNRHQLQGLFNPFNENPFQGIVTTEVDVTTYARRDSSLDRTTTTADTTVLPGIIHPNKTDDFSPYSVNIEVGRSPHPDLRSYSRNGPDPQPPSLLRLPTLTRTHALQSAHPESWLYARAAFLFFCALLISWVPSSANRLYALVHPDAYIFGLNYTESLVLPLQGFWNAIVYIITSQTACRNLWRAIIQQPSRNGAVGPLKHTKSGGSTEIVPIKLDTIKNTTTATTMGKADNTKKPDRSNFPALGSMKSKGGDSRLERFASRRTSQRLESDESSFASLGRG